MKKTQQGFAHLALILLLIVVAVAAYAGYKVVKNHQKITSANQTSTSITSTPSQAINSKADLDKAANTLNGQKVDSDLNPDSLNNDVSTLL
jgi:Tfp pilus assembly protein PilX